VAKSAGAAVRLLGISNDLLTITFVAQGLFEVFLYCVKFDVLRHHFSTSFTAVSY
jgi:hypothetical protein